MKVIFHVSQLVFYALLVAMLPLFSAADAATYRVGPGERNEKVSDVADILQPGDVVEITGDIADSFVLINHGLHNKPITIRGLVTVSGGEVVRPRITIANASARPGILCLGNWNTFEGLDISGARGESFATGSAVGVACANLVIRNCRIHHNRQGIVSQGADVGDVLIEFCEFDSNGYSPVEDNPNKIEFGHSVYMSSNRPGAVVSVQHCYFHDGTGGAFVKSRFPRTAVRYNWFESSYISTLNIVGPIEQDLVTPAVYPMHCDIFGNVFDQGRGPSTGFSIMQIGGDSERAPGTEGTFNIAHNLFIVRWAYPIAPDDETALFPGQKYTTPITVHGNVDRMRLYNNIFLEYGVPGAVVYEPGTDWPDTPRSKSFRKKRGSGELIIEGANNFVSQRTKAVPEELSGTLRGGDPGFVDFINADYRPGADSPLACSGSWPLPAGSVVPLKLDFEPVRGIPSDLKPKRRAETIPPSIGPFEHSETNEMGDEEAIMLLAEEDNGTNYTWPLDYGRARRRMRHLSANGKHEEALKAAKAYFILCPATEYALRRAMDDVIAILEAMPDSGGKAALFEKYALYGSGAEDGKEGTAGELSNPLADVDLCFPEAGASNYAQLDQTINERASVWGTWQRDWYETEKARVRIDGGEFEESLGILAGALASSYRRTLDESFARDRSDEMIDRAKALLSAIYRGRHGTIAGFEEFWQRFSGYLRYGADGPDGKMGTQDDIEPPI